MRDAVTNTYAPPGSYRCDSGSPDREQQANSVAETPPPLPPARAWSRQTQSHAKLTMSRSGALLFRTFYPAASAPARDSERGAYPQVTPLGAPTENGSVASNVLRVDARIPKRKTTLHSTGRMATRTRPTHTLRHNGEQPTAKSRSRCPAICTSSLLEHI